VHDVPRGRLHAPFRPGTSQRCGEEHALATQHVASTQNPVAQSELLAQEAPVSPFWQLLPMQPYPGAQSAAVLHELRQAVAAQA
jgi:hypothetical protein